MRVQSILRPLLAVFVAAAFLTGHARADELTAEKRADIDRLFAMTGSLSIGKQMATAMAANVMQSLSKARPDIPARVLELVPGEVGAVFDENVDSLKNELVPLYHQNFTHPEIRELIAFYASEIGQKTIKVMPVMLQQSMVVGQRWGQALGPQIEQRIKARLQRNGVQI